MAPIRTTDQVFKGIMKQENTDDRLFYRIIKEDFDEADHHNDSQLLQKGTETEEKRNTVDTTIKTKMDSIKGYEFQGTVKNEKNYSECIGLINLDLTSNCIHIGEKQYTCDICGQHCLQKPNLRRHLKTHIVKKVYKCDTCDQAFSRVFNLRVHRRAHTGEKPHKCVICNQAFTRAYTLKLHERIHTGEKPHKCEICARAFSRIFNLRVHKKVHTGEKPYKCDICDQAFSRLYRLKIHTRKHTG